MSTSLQAGLDVVFLPTGPPAVAHGTTAADDTLARRCLHRDPAPAKLCLWFMHLLHLLHRIYLGTTGCAILRRLAGLHW